MIFLKKRYFIVLLILCYSFANAQIQDSTRRQKISFIEFITKRRNFLIAPQFDRNPETGFVTGLYYLQLFKHKKDTSSRTSNIETFLSVTERKQYILELNETILFSKERFYLKGYSIVNKYNEFFYGVGNNINPH